MSKQFMCRRRYSNFGKSTELSLFTTLEQTITRIALGIYSKSSF